MCPECRRPLIALTVDEIKDFEVDQCRTCGGIWFDHQEWDHLAAVNRYVKNRSLRERDTTWGEWAFQLALGLPIEFNIRPRHTPWGTLSIVIICLVLHVVGLWHRLLPWGLVATGSFDAELLITLITHQFIHANWLHLFGNMYFLYVLGDNVEDVLGTAGFVVFYLICGVVSAIPHLYFAAGSEMPLVGASGGIAGVMAAYFVLFRRAQLTFMFIVFQLKVPAAIWLGIWFGIQLFGAFGDPSGAETSIGWLAHVAGFVCGLAIILPLRRMLIERHPLLHLMATNRIS